MSRILMILFLLISPMTLITYSQSTDSVIINEVLKQLEIEQSACYSDLIVYKMMPYARGKSVLVIPEIIEKNENSFTFDSYVLVINNQTSEILNKFYESNAWVSDALRIAQISIDFAPYKLNSSTRAFGIRVLYEGSSRPNPYENEEISLFVPKDSSLVRVLRNFSISSIGGEWDTHCEGQFTTTKKVLAISDKATNSYCDIIVKTKITSTQKILVNCDCIDKDTIEESNGILHYNSDEYTD